MSQISEQERPKKPLGLQEQNGQAHRQDNFCSIDKE